MVSVTLAGLTFCLFVCKIQPTVYIKITNPSRGRDNSGGRVCLASVGRVTLENGTNFQYLNTLARLTGTTIGGASVT